MSSFLVIVVALLIFFFVFLWTRRQKVNPLKNTGLSIGGVGLGIVATIVLVYIDCLSYPDPYCGTSAIFFGPILILAGLFAGIALTWFSKRRKK